MSPKEPSKQRQKRKSENPEARQGHNLPWLALKMEGPCVKEKGPSSYNCKELDPINNLNEHGSRFFPRASRQEPRPDSTLISVLEGLELRIQTSPLGLLIHNTAGRLS